MTDNSFIDINSMNDNAIIEKIGAFIRHHRMDLNKTQSNLSKEAGISRSTLSSLERGETVTVNTLVQVLRVLGQLHVLSAFHIKERISPIALIKLQKKRKRASGTSDKSNKNEGGVNW